MNNFKISTPKIISKEIKQVFNKNVYIPDDLTTNDKIKEQFLVLLRQSHIIPSNVILQILKLIDKQVIIPVNNKKKGFLGLLFKKIKDTCVPFSYSEGTMAFYSGASNRIYIIVDNIMKAKGNADAVSRTIVHELQHMQGHNFPSEFFSLHKKLILSFYTEFFKIISANHLKVNIDAVEHYAKFLVYMFDDIFSSYGAVITQSDFDSYRDKVALVYRTEGKKIPQLGMDIANALTLCAETMIDGQFFEIAAKNPKSIQRLLYTAYGMTYKKLGMDPAKLKSFFGQECIVPTEIVAMLPEIKIEPSLFAFLNRL